MSNIINITNNAPTFTADNINHYTTLNWQKVCKVNKHHDQWYYSEVDQDLMFSEHRSWVYAITVDDTIVKIGETGQPLGIESSFTNVNEDWEPQPITGTRSRLGRYRAGDGTDARIRENLSEEIQNDQAVEIYAFKCPVIEHKFDLNGKVVSIKASIHKDLEKTLMDYFVYNTGDLPLLNPHRA